jgi:thioredoxin-related protein
VYPDDHVAGYIQQHLIPVKIHVKKQPEIFDRFGAQWTPTLVFLDGAGREVYRFEGYLPVDDFLAQLELGVAKGAFAHQDFTTAEQEFRKVYQDHPDTAAAAEAQYWAGVSRYKGTGDAAALRETAARFKKRYRDSDWAKKASVWEG